MKPGPDAPSSAVAPQAKAAPRILIVDDDAPIRSVLRRILDRRGYEIMLAATAGEATRLIASSSCDIVITDLNMPGEMDGQDLFRWIMERGSSTDVILLSGAPTLESTLEAFRFGAWDYFIKPVDNEALRDSIGRCLQSRRLDAGGEDPRALRRTIASLSRKLNATAQLRGILNRHISKPAADKMLSAVRPSPINGEKKDVSVLFADIRGFTRFAERQGPEETLATINQLFTRLNSTIDRRHGFLDKYTGDGLMVVFGAFKDQRDHAASAALCAQEMMEATAAWNEERGSPGLPALAIGIGINTGAVIMGNVGCAQRSDFTVIGPVVNLASRLTDLASAGQILVGPGTLAAVSLDFPTRSRGLVRIRGLSATTLVSELLPRPGAASPAPEKPGAAARRQAGSRVT